MLKITSCVLLMGSLWAIAGGTGCSQSAGTVEQAAVAGSPDSPASGASLGAADAFAGDLTTFGIVPGEPIPDPLELDGEIYRGSGPQGVVVYWRNVREGLFAPDALFVFTDAEQRVSGVQWALFEGGPSPKQLVLDFIVPTEAFAEPSTPGPEALYWGDLIGEAVANRDRGAIQDAVAARIEVERELDWRHIKGPLMAGVLDSGTDRAVTDKPIVIARAPRDVGEYVFYFVARTPSRAHFPELDGWGWAEEAKYGRSGWFMGVIMPVLVFFDMSGITQPGFDVTVHYHDYAYAREARIRNLGGRRIRIDARTLPDADGPDLGR